MPIASSILTPYASPSKISSPRIFKISLGIRLGPRALPIGKARIIIAISFYIIFISTGTKLLTYISKACYLQYTYGVRGKNFSTRIFTLSLSFSIEASSL